MEKNFTKEEITTKVIDMASDKFGVDRKDINLESDFVAHLGADSLDLVEMTMSVEKGFGVSVSDSDAQHFKTVGDVIAFLENQLETKE